MKTKRKRIGMLAFIVMIAVLMIVTMQTPGTIADSENYQCQTYATVFALLPPVIAIGLGFESVILHASREGKRIFDILDIKKKKQVERA